MLKYYSSFIFFVFVFNFYFSLNQLKENLILDISFIKAVSSGSITEDSSDLSLELTVFGVFQGRQSSNLVEYLGQYGIGHDLSVKKKCDKEKIKVLTKEYELLLFKLFENYGELKELEKSNNRETITSTTSLNSYREEVLNQNKVINALLKELYTCIISKVAAKYANKSMRTNNKGCSLIYLVYSSSLKKISKIILTCLKKILVKLSKIYNQCLKKVEINPENCYKAAASISRIERSISLQNQVLKESKINKKKCKYYLRNKIMTRLFTQNQNKASGDIIFEDTENIVTYL